MGIVEKGRFTGSILFHVQAEGQVLNPPDGLVIEGEVVRKNKMGVYVNYKDAIRVIVPRDLNIGDDQFEGISVGDTIKVEIKKSRFQVNDEYILSVGLFKGVSTAAVRAVAAAAPEEAADEEAPPTEEEQEAAVNGAPAVSEAEAEAALSEAAEPADVLAADAEAPADEGDEETEEAAPEES